MRLDRGRLLGTFSRLAAASGLAALAVGPAGAVLIGTSAGYQYVAGSGGYWGHDLNLSGNARLDGGWYPLTRLSLVNDASYSWIAAPAVGLERGFPGLGRARLVYTLSAGELRENNVGGLSHTFELGWFRALSPQWSGDVSYRITDGDLFSGITRVIDVTNGQATDTLGSALYHQGQLAFGWAPALQNFAIRLDGTLAAAVGTNGQRAFAQALSASVPVYGGLWATASTNFIEDNIGVGRLYAGMGLQYSFAGTLQRGGQP